MSNISSSSAQQQQQHSTQPIARQPASGLSGGALPSSKGGTPYSSANPLPSSTHAHASSEASGAGGAVAQHLLSLKFLRISPPEFQLDQLSGTSLRPTFPPGLLEEVFQHEAGSLEKSETASTAPPASNASYPFILTDTLILPTAFGNIYLGESLKCYLSINNECTDKTITGIRLKAELQTTANRFTLIDTPSAPASLAPFKSLQFNIAHEIKEIGIHILVCTVQYDGKPSDSGDSILSFRKFFKFHVLNPLSIKTKTNTLHQGGKIILEAQVQNVSSSRLFFERLKFDANDAFDVTDLNVRFDHSGPGGLPLSVFGTEAILHENDTRQYLYMLTPKSLAARISPNLGKLDISWRSNMGTLGRLQTSTLVRKPPPVDPFEIFVVSAPTSTQVESPFSVCLKITNNLVGESLDLLVESVKSKMSRILMNGASAKVVGLVAPQESVEFTLEFFPLFPGIQKITGIGIREMGSGILKEIDSLAEILISN